MKLACVIVLQKWSFTCSLLVAVACGVRHQVLVSPKLGFNPKSELPFVVHFQLFEFKGGLYPKPILPSEVTSSYVVLPTASSA